MPEPESQFPRCAEAAPSHHDSTQSAATLVVSSFLVMVKLSFEQGSTATVLTLQCFQEALKDASRLGAGLQHQLFMAAVQKPALNYWILASQY